MAQFAHFNVGRNETFRVLAKLPESNLSSTPLNITDYTFTGKVRENYTTDEVAAEFTINKIQPYSSGAIVLELENSKTKNLSLRKYVYDIMAESGSFKRKILEGYINVRRQVTPFTNPISDTREYQSQFAVSQFLESSSITLRPDAVSFDYKTAFTLGPTEIGGGAGGFLFEKVWKIRADDNNNVWYSVEEGVGWSAEGLLFSFSGSSAIEIDAAFEQQGRLNVVVQRNTGIDNAPEVWLYWFDPILNNFTFQNLGTGRTPRISLDDWQTLTDSDILVFYVNDTVDRIQYRVQRDRFNIVYNTPITNVENIYLEKVAFATDYRYRVTYSQRNTVTGKYELKQAATRRYPIILPNEPFYVTGSFISATIQELVKTSSLEVESFNATGSVVSMSIRDIILTSSLYNPESFYVTGSFVTAGILDLVKTGSLEVESFYTTGSFVTAGTKEILITSSLYDVEPFYVTGSVISIEVIIP